MAKLHAGPLGAGGWSRGRWAATRGAGRVWSEERPFLLPMQAVPGSELEAGWLVGPRAMTHAGATGRGAAQSSLQGGLIIVLDDRRAVGEGGVGASSILRRVVDSPGPEPWEPGEGMGLQGDEELALGQAASEVPVQHPCVDVPGAGDWLQ